MTLYLESCLVGAAVTLLAGVIMLLLHKDDGVLRIDSSNPEKDIYRLDIRDLDSLSGKKRITLKVDNHADLSQD